MAEATPTHSPLRDHVVAVIREFPYDDFGMDEVSYALEADPDSQEWVPALADKILTAVRQRSETEADGGES
ncbi:hypothetical protein [Streptomyces sp. NPDC050416]|uniref:hypothetical protein n=1 Tax=Streptomyces sp. NPDC050416 TaxID=3365611 RepID=UPI0037B4A296